MPDAAFLLGVPRMCSDPAAEPYLRFLWLQSEAGPHSPATGLEFQFAQQCQCHSTHAL